jgi:chromosome segregation protein
VKLKRLVLQGFKSFKDKTTIHFENGITGIVGPNGCGKSNIVDALFWVMGEMSAKHLRGNSMKDVIFAGSSKFKPGTWAEVSLVLDNDEGKHIHIAGKVAQPSEIELTRKLYRNGESEFRINGLPCRLKDIQEIFMDTGAGAKSYSIIAQGEINKLVQAKPEERRVMIEEVAGITKFKMRRRESVKKIELTQSNLERIADLQNEIYKNLKSLEGQAEKAERAKSLRDKIKRNEFVVKSHEVFDLLKDLKETHAKILQLKTDLELFSAEKSNIELSLAGERIEQDDLIEKIDSCQKKYNETSKELAAGEERLSHLQSRISEREVLQKEKNKEIQEIDEDIINRTKKLEDTKQSQETLKTKLENGFEFSDLENLVTTLKDEWDLKSETHLEMNSRINELKNELMSKEKIFFQKNNRLQEVASQVEDITLEVEALEKQISLQSKDLIEEKEYLKKLKISKETKETEYFSLKESVKSVKEKLPAVENEFRQIQKQLINKEAQYNSLVDLRKDFESLQSGIEEFIQASGDRENFEILANLIECDESCTFAVEEVLDSYLNALIVQDDQISKVKSWLQENSSTGFKFINSFGQMQDSQSDTVARLELFGFENVKPLMELIKVKNPQFFSSVNQLLSGYFVVDQLKEESLFAIKPEMRLKGIVDRHGKKIFRKDSTISYFINYGEESQKSGVIERNNKISFLENEISKIQIQYQDFERQCENLKSENEQNEKILKEVSTDYFKLKEEFIAKNSALESRLKGSKEKDSRLEILSSRNKKNSTERMELIEHTDKLQKEINDLQQQLKDQVDAESYLAEEVQELNSKYQAHFQELTQKQVEAKTWETSFASIENLISDLENQMNKLAIRKTNNQESLVKIELELSTAKEDLGQLRLTIKDLVDKIKLDEKQLKIVKGELEDLQGRMQNRENQLKSLAFKGTKSEKELSQAETKVEQWREEEAHLVIDFFEKHRVNLRKTVASYLEYTEEEIQKLLSIESMYHSISAISANTTAIENSENLIEEESFVFNRRYGQDLKECQDKLKYQKIEYGRLGDINWQAIEDYQKQKIRHDFLKQQEEELKKSLVDLQLAIDHIDEKSRERFKEAYTEVNQRFEKVFPIIFGGGNAKLQLIGDIDSPECGVDIVAQPPGKKMQNINLMSGGEKALTAVSLIFSIFLVKPSPFCLLDEVDAPLDDANVGRFNDLLKEMSDQTQFILITHNKKTMELNDTLYGVTMQEPGISNAVSVRVQ